MQQSKTVYTFATGTGRILPKLSPQGISQRGASTVKSDMDIHEKLRLLRTGAGYSQEYIADTISADQEFKDSGKKGSENRISQKRVSHIENFQCHIMEHELKAWCKVFLITVGEFYSESIGRLLDLMLERKSGKGDRK